MKRPLEQLFLTCHRPVLVAHCLKVFQFHFRLYYSLYPGKDVLEHGRNPNSLLGSERFMGDIIAIKMNFARKSSV